MDVVKWFLTVLTVIGVAAHAQDGARHLEDSDQDIARKTVGRRFTPIPLLNYSSDEGVGYGVRVAVYDYNGRTVPYRRAFKAQLFLTTEGNWAHQLSLDIPELMSGQRMDIQASLDKQAFANYYGELSDAEVDSLDLSRAQRTFRMVSPKLTVQWIRDLELPWRHRIGFEVNHTSIAPNADSASILNDLRPTGFKGGWLFKIGSSLRYDTRDNYVNTRDGFLEELLVEYQWGPAGGFNGWLMSLEHRHFLALGEAWVIGYRIEADRTFGDIPFYQELKLGGESTLRGLPAARVRGQGRFLWNSEIRWRGVLLSDKRNMYLGAIVFADVGHIYNRKDGPSFDPVDWRKCYGSGLRFYWHSTIVRVDYGFSKNRTGLYITFSHVF